MTVPNVRPSNDIQAGQRGDGVYDRAEYKYEPHSVFRATSVLAAKAYSHLVDTT